MWGCFFFPDKSIAIKELGFIHKPKGRNQPTHRPLKIIPIEHVAHGASGITVGVVQHKPVELFAGELLDDVFEPGRVSLIVNEELIENST